MWIVTFYGKIGVYVVVCKKLRKVMFSRKVRHEISTFRRFAFRENPV